MKSLIFFSSAIYVAFAGFRFNDTFYVWTPARSAGCQSEYTSSTASNEIQCQTLCERFHAVGKPCLGVSYDAESTACHLCDTRFDGPKSGLLRSDLMIASPSTDGKGAVISLTGAEQELPRAGGLTNSCNYFATDADTAKAGLGAIMKSACEAKIAKNPDAEKVNADSFPYKMCLMAQTAIWSGLTPKSGQRVVASDTFTNQLSQKVSHTFALTGNYGESISLSTTNTVGFSESVGYDVTIPDILTAKFSITTSMSSATTQTHSNTNSAGYSSSTAVDLNPGQTIEADLSVETEQYSSHFSVPICLSGYFRCQYGSKVNGHYYWYLKIDDFASTSQRCVKQSGQMASAISIKSKTTVKKL